MLVPRIFGLERFVATDEAAWLNRSANFYYALGQREFAETYRNVSVAVFTMWINTFAFLIKFPGYRGLGQGYLGAFDVEWDSIFRDQHTSELSILATGRLLTVIALTIAVVLIFWYLKRLLGTVPALVSSLIFALDPFYVATSRTSHLDAPMGTFLILAILAYYTYLKPKGKWVDMIISGFAGALSLLSKLPGILTIPGVLGVSTIVLLSTFGKSLFKLGKRARKQIGSQLRLFAIWLLIYSLAFTIIWPAMWVHPLKTARKVILGPLNFLDTPEKTTGGTASMGSQDGTNPAVSQITKTITGTFHRLLFYINSYLWRTTPIILLGLIWLLFGYWFRWALLAKEDVRLLVRIMIFVAVFFVAVISIPSKISEKYIIPSYLALDVAAGIGWVALVALLGRHLKTKSVVSLPYILLFLVVAGQSILVWDHYPYYFSYYNPLLGGSKRAGKTRFVGVGEGLDQAAEFLNQMPNAEDLVVQSWYGRGPFSFFFKGKTITIPTGITWSDKFAERLAAADFLVVYTNQWYRRIPPELFDILEDIEPVHRVWLEGIEYVRIYRVKDIPLESYVNR
jgi:4-amino-4-deoxy-L-arabinose transferase-like glycosyltransferase